jgi:hypothetical protein
MGETTAFVVVAQLKPRQSANGDKSSEHDTYGLSETKHSGVPCLVG